MRLDKTENTNLDEPELGLGHNRDMLLRLGHPGHYYLGLLLKGSCPDPLLSRICISIDPFFLIEQQWPPVLTLFVLIKTQKLF